MKFNPLIFLASLGAGGIAIAPFAFMQYSIAHPKWLIALEHILPFLQGSSARFYYLLMGIMVVFGAIHVILSIIFFVKLFRWLGTKDYKSFMKETPQNIGIMTPLLSFAMTMNFMIGTIRFFIPAFSGNLQSVMLPALIFWLLLFAFTIVLALRLTKKAFVQKFDIKNINFGRLLPSFTIGMVTVVGSGIAALAKDPTIAHTAAFFSFVGLGIGLFLLVVKLISLFQKYFGSHEGLPAKNISPSFLIVIPNITLYAIILFRLGHYFAHRTGVHMEAFSFFIILGAFAFQTRYFVFSFILLKEYFKEHFFKKDFYASLRGLICPFVAYSVLGSFVYPLFFDSIAIYILVVVSMFIAIVAYVLIARRNLICKTSNIKCG